MLVWGLPASDQITECTKGKGTAMKQQFLHENWEMQPYPEAYTATCFPTEKWKTRSGKTMKTMPAS